MKRILAPAGQRTRILRLLSDSIPQTVRFTARRVDCGGPPEGTVEISRIRWFVRQPTEIRPLEPDQAIPKGFADVDYAIDVTPQADTEIVFQTRHFRMSALIWVLVAVVVLSVVSALVVPLLR